MKFSITLLAAMALTGGFASAYTISEFKASKPTPLHIPALPDSLSKENPFSKTSLLDSRNGLAAFRQNWTTVKADTAGNIAFSESEAQPQLHSFSTRLRAERFCKGRLSLSTSSIANLIIDGTSMAQKEDADSTASEISADLTMNPEQDFDITVNILTMPGDKGKPEFNLSFTPEKEFEDVNVTGGAEISRRFSPVNTMTGERVNGLSLSPDGKYLVTRYSETISASQTYYRAVLSETATGKILDSDINISAEWMPGQNKLYFTKEKKGSYDLYTLDVPSLSSKVIASGLPESEFALTPDLRYAIYYKTVEGTKETGVMRRVKSPDDRIPGDRDRYYIMRYDLQEGISVPLTYGGASTMICDLSRDGKKLLWLASRQTPAEYPFYLNTLVETDLSTLKNDTIIADNGYITNAIYSPDATRLFITGGPQAFGDLGVNAGNHEIPNSFDNQGYIYTIATGDVKALTRDFDPSIERIPIWNAADNKIYFVGEEGFNNNLFSLDPKSGKINRLENEVPNVSDFTMGENSANWLAYYGGDFTDTGAAYLINLRTLKTTLIDDPMKKALDGIEFGKTEPWKFTSSFGDEIDGYMCLPPGFDPSKKYPLIVYYYGGTSPSSAAMHHLYGPQVFASRDYVVYVLNPSGTTGYGQEFSARHVNAWGRQTAEEIIEGVKEFCRQHEFVDKKKVGCLGASYGGFMTQYLQTLTDIFAAAVSHAGISNVTSYWGEGYWGYSYNSVAAAKHYPWTDPELYTRQGSLFNADKIHTPLLLLHGTQDTNVPIGESIQIFNALRVLGRDVEFITVEDENHVISNFDRKLLWQNTIMAWFAKYLQDDPRWWDSLYGN